MSALRQTSTLQASAGAVQTLDASLQSTEVDLLQAGQQLVALQTQLQKVTADRDAAKVAEVAAAQHLTEASNRLSTFGVAEYMTGPPSSALLDALAAGDSSRGLGQAALQRSVLGDLSAAYDSARREQVRATQVLTEHQRSVDVATGDVREAQQRRDQLSAERDTKIDRLANGRSELAALREQVAATAQATLGGGSIGSLLAARQRAETPPAIPARIFAWPLRSMHLTSPFGYRTDPLGNGIGFHPGADFGAPSGTPIYAAGDGIVVIAAPEGGYGNCTVIDHGSGLATLYGHQLRQVVAVGDVVRTGEIIGYVGSTGASTGPHLHFEVRLRGQLTDPLPWLNPGVPGT